MNLKNPVVGAVVAMALVGSAGAASATVNLNVHETFASGATFTGVVTFADDYSSVTDVTGTLAGYQYGTSGYVGGAATDLIDWVWMPRVNYDTNSATTFGAFLMDGPVNDYSAFTNFITFDYDYTNAPHIVFDIGPDLLSATNGGNNVSYTDPLASGSIGAVPEPATWAMMLMGLGAIGGAMRAARRKSALASAA